MSHLSDPRTARLAIVVAVLASALLLAGCFGGREDVDAAMSGEDDDADDAETTDAAPAPPADLFLDIPPTPVADEAVAEAEEAVSTATQDAIGCTDPGLLNLGLGLGRIRVDVCV